MTWLHNLVIGAMRPTETRWKWAIRTILVLTGVYAFLLGVLAAEASPAQGEIDIPVMRCGVAAVVFDEEVQGFAPYFIGDAGDSSVVVEIFSPELACVRHHGLGAHLRDLSDE